MWTRESFAELLKRHGCIYVSLEKWTDEQKAKAREAGVDIGDYDSMVIDGMVDSGALVDELNKEITKHW